MFLRRYFIEQRYTFFNDWFCPKDTSRDLIKNYKFFYKQPEANGQQKKCLSFRKKQQ